MDRPSITDARRILAVLICALALSACAASSNQNPPPGAAVVEAPDYAKEGGTWTYHVVHQMWTGGYRSDMDNGDYVIRIRNGKFGIARLEAGKIVHPPPRSWLHAALPIQKIIEEKEQYYNFPLWIGKEWSGTQRLGRWRDSRCTVTGMEAVTTPAGTFQSFRIERRIVMLVDILNYYDTEIYFYSPQTRSIVKYDYKREMKDLVGDLKYGLEETASFELLSYKAEPESSQVRSARAN